MRAISDIMTMSIPCRLIKRPASAQDGIASLTCADRLCPLPVRRSPLTCETYITGSGNLFRTPRMAMSGSRLTEVGVIGRKAFARG